MKTYPPRIGAFRRALLASALVSGIHSDVSGVSADCIWDKGGDGIWTIQLDQFSPEIASDWDCPGVPPLLEINFPNYIPGIPPAPEVTFNVEIGGGHTVTVTPILPIVISNLTLMEGAEVALIDGVNLFIQNTDGGRVESDGVIRLSNSTGALPTNLTVDGPVTFSGGGSVLLEGGVAFGGNQAVNLSATAIIEDHRIEGHGALGAESMSLRIGDAGLVVANMALEALEIDPGPDNNIINRGILASDEGGVLRIKRTAISNADGNLDAGSGSSIELQEVTLSNGTLSGSGVIRGISTVTLEGPITQTGTYVVGGGTTTILEGPMTNDGQITLAGGSFVVAETTVIEGGGTISLGAPDGALSTFGAVFDSGATLENRGNRIEGGGNLSVPLTNNGSIVANDPAVALRVIGDLENNTTIVAENGATLDLRSQLDNADGQIEAKDGLVAVNFGGAIRGGAVDIRAGSTLELSDGVVDATTTIEPNGGIAVRQFITNELSGQVSNPEGGEIVIDDSARLVLTERSSYINEGVISLNSQVPFSGFANTALILDGDIRLQGGGTIEMTANSGNAIYSQAGIFGKLINVDQTIRGAGHIGRNTTGIENSGEIHADQPPNGDPGSGVLSLDPGAELFVNTGLIRASLGGILEFRDGVYNNQRGRVEATDGSCIQVAAGTHISEGILETTGDASIDILRDATLDGTPISIDSRANIHVIQTGLLRLIGQVSNSKTLRVEDGGRLRIDGPVTLSGGGEIHLVGADSRIVNFQDSLPDDRLINVDNTIRGAGQIQFLAIENGGTIAPGASPGRLTVAELTQKETASMELEIVTAGNGEYDSIHALGAVALNGSLEVITPEGVDIQTGDRFEILQAGSITGSFADVIAPIHEQTGEGIFDIERTATAITLIATRDYRRKVPYDQWTRSQRLDGANSGLSDDPNQDGIPNVAAYYWGLPALGPNTDRGIEIDESDAGLRLSFSSPLTVEGVNISLEVSSDLAPGSFVAGPTPESVGLTDTRRLYEVFVPAHESSVIVRFRFVSVE